MLKKIIKWLDRRLCEHEWKYIYSQDTIDFIKECEHRISSGESLSYSYTVEAECKNCGKKTALRSDLMC